MTGATGFIGSHVVEALLRRDVEVIATSRDKNKAELLGWYKKVRYIPYDMNILHKEVFDELGRPDILIHLAWEGLPNYQAVFHKEKNLPVHCSFLENMVKGGLKKLVVIGTCLEYGMKTGCLSEDMKPEPIVPYAQAKDDLRRYLEKLKDKMHFELIWVRLFYMFGPGQSERSLLPQLQKAIDRGETSFNMSKGQQLRDYLPVEEVAENIVRISLQNKVSGVINCCSGRPISVRDFVQGHLKKMGKKIDLNWGYYPYLDYEPMEFWGDTRRLKESFHEQ